jgi:hypothetical protein
VLRRPPKGKNLAGKGKNLAGKGKHPKNIKMLSYFSNRLKKNFYNVCYASLEAAQT